MITKMKNDKMILTYGAVYLEATLGAVFNVDRFWELF